MRYFGGSGPETPALAAHRDLMYRRAVLDDQHEGLDGYGITEPEVYVGQLEDGHTFIGIDMSGLPGGAFKYISSVASVITAPRGTTEVVAATAGNFGWTLGEAAMRASLKSRSFVPHDLNPVKSSGMESTGMTVTRVADSVELAAPIAEEYVRETPGAVLLHAYNNPWGIAGLTVMGEFVANTLRKLDANGQIDLADPTDVVVPLGGGSGVAGVASRLRTEKDAGSLPPTLSVVAARPRRLRDGSMDPRFDGLRVAVPGSNTAPFLEDQSFVRATQIVNELSVADGARYMAKLSKVAYEPNTLVAVGAIMQWIARNPDADRRNFVAVLTGRNSDPDVYERFKTLPGYESSQEQQRWREARTRRIAAEAASIVSARTVVNSRKIAPKPRYGAMLRAST